MDVTTNRSYHNSARNAAPRGLADPARVAVVVLGDLGRSPRMLYHALALADAGAHVDLFGYRETELEAAVASHPSIAVHELRAPRTRVPRFVFVAHGLLRAVRQSVELDRRLSRVSPDTLLVQTPPAVPTLLVALWVARRARCRLVIDWHNFGWSLLAVRLGARHPVVRLARAWEHVLGRLADAHLCVSQAMAAELAGQAGIRAEVLYDRPAERFVPVSEQARTAVRASLAAEMSLASPPALVVVPSGWTADEDIGLLLDAALRLDDAIAKRVDAFPDVVIVATGFGPLLAHWKKRIDALVLRRVHLRTRWLSAEEYPAFVAAADVGVSLHRSASGVDLPMKIVDLLGAGVPVCALAYDACLSEMLENHVTGLFFETAEQLAAHLQSLLERPGADGGLLETLRRNIACRPSERWRDAWERSARTVLLRQEARC